MIYSPELEADAGVNLYSVLHKHRSKVLLLSDGQLNGKKIATWRESVSVGSLAVFCNSSPSALWIAEWSDCYSVEVYNTLSAETAAHADVAAHSLAELYLTHYQVRHHLRAAGLMPNPFVGEPRPAPRGPCWCQHRKSNHRMPFRTREQ